MITIFYREELKEYDFGPGHSFQGDRYEVFPQFLRENLAEDENYQIIKAEPASDEDLRLICQKDYIDFSQGYYKAANLGLSYPGSFSRFHSGDNEPIGRPGKLEEHNWKLDKRYKEIQEKEVMFELENTDDADIVLTGFGTSARICKAAMALGRKEGIKIGYFRPITVWPFPYKKLKEIGEKAGRVLTVEMNLGQMVEDVKLSVEGKARVFLYGRPGGGIPTPEQVLERVKLALES